MRVLVTGAAGTMGGALALALARRFDVVAARHRSAPPPGLPAVSLDLESRDSLAGALRAAQAEAVVHAAAIADVDLCEREPESARRANTLASENVAEACARAGLPLVAISTDLVFAGERSFVTEQDEPRPLSVYGRTKLDGERAVQAAHPASVVVRVPLIVGRGHGPRGTASEGIAWALHAGRPLRLYSDQFRAPLDATSLADGIARAFERHARGVFHFGGAERISRHALGLRVAALFGLPSAAIFAVTQAEQPAAGPRPADVCLEATRAHQELEWQPRPLDAMILDGRRTPDIIPASP